jgi:23S rRNA (guanine745-N1)-methyltransferase
MTPYRWRSPKQGIEKLFQLNSIKVTIDVNFDVFEKV